MLNKIRLSLLSVFLIMGVCAFSHSEPQDKLVMLKTKSNKAAGILFSSSSTATQFSTNVNLKIYNDHEQSIFSQLHDSFWQTEDAYAITLQYLIKRSPCTLNKVLICPNLFSRFTEGSIIAYK